MARLTSFTVHLPPPLPGRDADTRVEFVPDSFSPVAFLVPWVWFLWNRMWLVFVLYLAGMAAVAFVLAVSGLPPAVRMAIAFCISLLIGLEATNLKRRTLRRRGFREAGVIVAASPDEAERRWFAEGGRDRAHTAVSQGGPPPAHPIGLFPEADPGVRGAR